MSKQLFPVILNSSNLVSGSSNSLYRYTFPSGNAVFKNSKIAVGSVAVYYSFFNITEALGNNTYSYIFYDASGANTRVITMPDGFYSVSDLNTYLQSQMIANGDYLVTADGDYYYSLEIVTNSVRYAVQWNCYSFGTSLPSGYSNPAGVTFPATASVTQVVIPSGNFTNIVGLPAATYPTVTQTTTYSQLSTYTPQLSPQQSVILTCSLLSNKYSNPQTVLYSFSPAGTDFGSLIQSNPYEYSFVSIKDGTYNTFDIQFLDQEFGMLKLEDSNVVITLLILFED